MYFKKYFIVINENVKDKNKPELKTTDKKKLKMSLGKSKVDVNPDVDLGIYSGGSKTPNGNLH